MSHINTWVSWFFSVECYLLIFYHLIPHLTQTLWRKSPLPEGWETQSVQCRTETSAFINAAWRHIWHHLKGFIHSERKISSSEVIYSKTTISTYILWPHHHHHSSMNDPLWSFIDPKFFLRGSDTDLDTGWVTCWTNCDNNTNNILLDNPLILKIQLLLTI